MEQIYAIADVPVLKRKRENSVEDVVDDEDFRLRKQKEESARLKRQKEEEDRLRKQKEHNEKLREEAHQYRVSLYEREIKQIRAMREARAKPQPKYVIPISIPQKTFTSEQCPFCLENLKENDLPLQKKITVFLTCGHSVHYECIKTYFCSLQSEGRCPVCRSQEKRI
jgi:hypothetical protein